MADPDYILRVSDLDSPTSEISEALSEHAEAAVTEAVGPQVEAAQGAARDAGQARDDAVAARDVAKDARDAATAAKIGAETASNQAQAFGGTNDSIVTGILNDPATQFSIAQALRDVRVEAEGMARSGMYRPRVMSTPPRIINGKRQGLSVAALSSIGSGYSVNDRLRLVGGTFDLSAEVTVTQVNESGGIIAVSGAQGGSYSVLPASPVSVTPVTGTGTGATLTPTWSGPPSTIAGGTTYAATNAAIRFTGCGPLNLNSSGYYGDSVDNGQEVIWEWESDTPILEIHLGGLNTSLTLFIDGERVRAADFTTLADGAWNLIQLDLGVVRWRSYKIVGRNMGLNSLRVPATYTVRAPEIVRPLNLGLGDSYMAASGARGQGVSEFSTANEMLGWDHIGRGVGASGYNGGPSGTPLARINAIAPALSRAPDVVTLALGYNDQGGNMSSLTTNASEAIDRIRELWPAATIVILGPATPLGESANLATVKNAVKAVAQSRGLLFLDRANLVNANNKALYTSGDNVHPTFLGHVFLGICDAILMRTVLPLTVGV